MEDKTLEGEVIWFSAKKGIGFIKVEGSEDLFCHFSNILLDGYKTLKPGQRVMFEIGANHRGPQAINIRIVHEEQ